MERPYAVCPGNDKGYMNNPVVTFTLNIEVKVPERLYGGIDAMENRLLEDIFIDYVTEEEELQAIEGILTAFFRYAGDCSDVEVVGVKVL